MTTTKRRVRGETIGWIVTVDSRWRGRQQFEFDTRAVATQIARGYLSDKDKDGYHRITVGRVVRTISGESRIVTVATLCDDTAGQGDGQDTL